MLSHFALFRKLPLLAAIGGSLTLLGACKKALPDRTEITETRPTFSSEAPIPESSDSMQRLGFGAQTQFRWTTPPTWLLAPGTQMRQLNFSFGPNREGECYMSMTKGREGSTVDEISRWRKQMGQPAVDATDIEALPKLDLLKRPCPLVKLEGAYTPAAGMAMGALPSAPRADFGLLGVVLEVPAMQAVLTVKMVGPKALVQQEEANFTSFVTSLTPVVAPETP